jgi:putative ABC transport system permease protein
MLFIEFLRVGWSVIGMHKFRSALTLLSIAIGTFSIVLMSSLAASGTTTMVKGLEDMGGARMVLMFPKAPEPGERQRTSHLDGITAADAEALRGRVPHVVQVGLFSGREDREFQYGDKVAPRTDMVVGDDVFLSAMGLPLAAGRFFNAADLAAGARVVILGHLTAKALFDNPAVAIGKVIRSNGESHRVVGVVADVKRFGIQLGFDWDDFAAFPITTEGQKTQGALIMVTDAGAHNDIAKRVAAVVLRELHNGVEDFQAFDGAIIMEKMNEVFRIMHLIAGLIAGVALLAGGIGVMNILLVSVSERVREIGVRKALGAPDHAIALQFLFESALLSGLGGLVGAVLGCIGALASGPLIRTQAQVWVAVISFGAVGAALVSSLLIGIFFGLVPARKASRLLVVDCLRAAG